MNLAGLPFTLGFYIKHILFSSMAQNQVLISITMFFIVTAAVSGLIYSAKLYYYIFFDFKKGKKYMYEHTNQVSLKSILYSNTTMGANLAITGLIITGYTISIYLYMNWFSVLSISESLDLLTLESSNYYNFAWPVLIFLKSAAAIN
jgi:NADH:ubiquinone oxidoreductase subunit 2 (subunit N)